jgi:hypothetical protein
MRQNVIEETGGAERRMPGLQIVIVQPDGRQQIVAGPQPMPPMIEVTPPKVAEEFQPNDGC